LQKGVVGSKKSDRRLCFRTPLAPSYTGFVSSFSAVAMEQKDVKGQRTPGFAYIAVHHDKDYTNGQMDEWCSRVRTDAQSSGGRLRKYLDGPFPLTSLQRVRTYCTVPTLAARYPCEVPFSSYSRKRRPPSPPLSLSPPVIGPSTKPKISSTASFPISLSYPEQVSPFSLSSLRSFFAPSFSRSPKRKKNSFFPPQVNE